MYFGVIVASWRPLVRLCESGLLAVISRLFSSWPRSTPMRMAGCTKAGTAVITSQTASPTGRPGTLSARVSGVLGMAVVLSSGTHREYYRILHHGRWGRVETWRAPQLASNSLFVILTDQGGNNVRSCPASVLCPYLLGHRRKMRLSGDGCDL